MRSGEDLAPGASREDSWHRAFEFLFERLAVSWTISGAPPLTRQRELLGRLRLASPAERAWLRERLREHCAEHFPRSPPHDVVRTRDWRMRQSRVGS